MSLTTIGNAVKTLCKPILIFVATMFIVSSVQWACIRLYASHCAGTGWYGFLTNALTLGSPMCQFINHVQIALADYYVTIWASAATAAITWVSARGSCGSSEKDEKED